MMVEGERDVASIALPDEGTRFWGFCRRRRVEGKTDPPKSSLIA